jgi:cyclohexadieny/prephenate dehydrogenase
MFERIAIIGIGLIGASIARAARESGAAKIVALYDLDAGVRQRARELNLGEVSDEAGSAVANADLVVLAVPVGAMAAASEAMAAALKPDAIVTDVGSVKSAVVAAITAHAPPNVFIVPGHPIAGTEHSGPDAGFAALFKGRWHILTPLMDARPEYAAAVDKLEAFWRALGADVERMDVERHDVVRAWNHVCLHHCPLISLIAAREPGQGAVSDVENVAVASRLE